MEIILTRKSERLTIEFDDDGQRTGKNIEITYNNVSWDDIRTARTDWLEKTDLWYLGDRWDSLSTYEKGQLNSFRQTLRDIPQTYYDEDDLETQGANNACDNLPIPEVWF